MFTGFVGKFSELHLTKIYVVTDVLLVLNKYNNNTEIGIVHSSQWWLWYILHL